MYQAQLFVNRVFLGAEISPYLYGSFVEHMGRVVYSGIYEPEHQDADEDGFRKDVLELVQKMGVTCVRYPGGNFVSNYHWQDGVGPRELRPRRREIAWRSIETNEFGTDEFMKWAQKAGVMPILAVNHGTGGTQDALSLAEYCNLPTGTYYSDLRAKHGHPAPYGVSVWCLGNEMDGIWQIGHKTAEDYGKLAAQTAHALKALDPSIQTVVCGSSSAEMRSYTDWERIVLECSYEFTDYLSLHHYYGGQEKGTEEFLAQSLDLEQYIRTILGVCDAVQAKKRSQRKINICFDEWGVWEIPGDAVAEQVEQQNWPIAPAFSEQIYTMEDTLLFSSMLMAFVKFCDRVKIACQSLLTNISAAIMTERGGQAWVQPIYYPFAYMAKYGRGRLLQSVLHAPSYRTASGSEVPYLDYVVIWNEAQKEVVIFAVNRRPESSCVTIALQDFSPTRVLEHVILHHVDLKMTNLEDHHAIVPCHSEDHQLNSEAVTFHVHNYSWNMLRIQVP